MYYFDYAAATPLSPTVFKAMEPYFCDNFYNPSAQYLAAQQVRAAIDKARADVAIIMNVRPSEIVFTAGGTEANNLAVHGIMQQYPDGNCIVSAIEHDSILQPAKKYNYKIAPVNADGRVNLNELEKLIDDKTVLISIMYANNEIGTIQPLAEISKLIKRTHKNRLNSLLDHYSYPLVFHSDACQAPNYLQVLPNTLGVDMMTLNGGKIYGPKQSGVLFMRNDVKLEQLISGGGQEKGLRSGTENVAGIVGFAAALTDASNIRHAEFKRLGLLQQEAYQLVKKYLPAASVNGSINHRLPNNIHLTIPGADNERLMMALDEKGYMVAVGSACSASSDEPSHVLKAIGLSDEQARESLRITMGRSTNQEIITALFKTLVSII